MPLVFPTSFCATRLSSDHFFFQNLSSQFFFAHDPPLFVHPFYTLALHSIFNTFCIASLVSWPDIDNIISHLPWSKLWISLWFFLSLLALGMSFSRCSPLGVSVSLGLGHLWLGLWHWLHMHVQFSVRRESQTSVRTFGSVIALLDCHLELSVSVVATNAGRRSHLPHYPGTNAYHQEERTSNFCQAPQALSSPHRISLESCQGNG